MTAAVDKFQMLLRELFQFDCADLAHRPLRSGGQPARDRGLENGRPHAGQEVRG